MSKIETCINKIKSISPVKLIVLSFFITIIIGTILLKLPISYKSDQAPELIDALFISTSSACVTGLTMFDTWSQWSFFGQVVMAVLMQIGGLGLISFTTGITLLLRKRLGVRGLQIMKEYTNGNIINMHRLIYTIFAVSFSCEAIGALLLSIRFVPRFGAYGIWISIYTAISAYCNAGFDIMGIIRPNSSFTAYSEDPLVCLVVASLIIIGGIGFIVIVDIYNFFVNRIKNREKGTKISIHSVIVIKTSIVLILIGTILIFLAEYNNTLQSFNFWEKIHASFFQSTAARTAGFFSIPISEEKDITKIVTIILMFIGASPSSTGGGIKTTTFIVLISTVISVLKGHPDTYIHRHKIGQATVYKTLSIASLALFIVIVATGIMEFSEASKSFSSVDIVYEVVSAFGTVGLSTGITPFIGTISKIVLIITMFIGRVGPISLIIALTTRHQKGTESILPEGKIIVG